MDNIADNKTADSMKGKYTFSLSSTQIFISRYLDKIAWVFIFLLASYTALVPGDISPYGKISLIILCALPFLFVKIQKAFAYKVILDFNDKKVRLHMNRSSEVIELHFGDLENIRLNGYIIFIIKEKKIFYAESQNKKLLKCLNKIKNIEWGFLCSLFGPSNNVRDEIVDDEKDR